MKKQSIVKMVLSAFVLTLSISFAVVGVRGMVRVDRELSDYRTMLAARYGTSEYVYVTDNSTRPLWYGEPQGAYIHTGYVGGNMQEEDVAKIEVLDTGAAAEEALDMIESFDMRNRKYFGLVAIAAFAILEVLACTFCRDDKSEEVTT